MARAAVIPATSPPKRGARTTKRTTTKTTTSSRSATSEVTKPAPRTRTATASTVASQAKRGVRSTPKPTKDDDNTENETDDEIGVIEQPKPKATVSKPRGRPPTTTSSTGTSRGRKVAAAPAAADTDDSEEDELAQVEEAPKKQVGRPKKQVTKAEEAPKPVSAPRPRGRPKGSTNKTTKATTAEKESSSRSRVRAGTDVSAAGGPNEVFITTNSTMMKSNLLRGPAKKKKVTFQDMSDSEDMREPSPPPAGRKRGTVSGRQTGLAAKPARKTTTTPARGRKPTASKQNASKPLSPKKATQVAKSLSSYVSSDGEDDELSGAKSPIKLVVNSPPKHGSETTGLSSPVKRINFTTAQSPKNLDENGEPLPRPRRSIDFNDTAFMSSPARRPTPSPFNYTIRETPRRAGITLRDDVNPIVQPNFTPMQESPLKLSPKKANLGTPRLGGFSLHDDQPFSQPNFTPGQNSPLKSSPKKGLFGSTFMSQALPQESSTPFKSRSLLMSPAKKIASPFKSSVFGKSCPLPESPASAQKKQGLDAANVEPAHESPLRGVEQEEERDADDDMDVDNAVVQDPADMEADYPSGDEGHEHDSIPDADMGANQLPSDVQDDQTKHLEEAGAEGDMSPFGDIEPASTYLADPSHGEPQSNEEPCNKEESGFQESELNEEQEEGDFQEPMDMVEGETALLALDANNEDCEKLTEPEGHLEATEAIDQLPENATPDNSEGDHEHEEPVTDMQAAQVVQEHIETSQKQPSQVSDEEQLGPDPESEGANTPPGSPLCQDMAEGLEDPFTDNYPATETQVIIQEVEDDEEPVTAGDGGSNDNMGIDEDHFTTCDTDHGDTLLVFDATEHGTSQPQALTIYEIDERRDSVASQKLEHCLPSAPSPPKPTEYRDPEDHMESIMEDTVSVTERTTEFSVHTENAPTPLTINQSPLRPERRRSNGPRFTLLAEQLSGWKASSPEKSEKARPRKRGVFSLAGNLKRPSDAFSVTSDVTYPALSLEELPLSVDSQENQTEDEGPTIFSATSSKVISALLASEALLTPYETYAFDSLCSWPE